MNYWTELSIEYANQRSYLDDLFHVYPLNPGGIRSIHENTWQQIENAFKEQDNDKLIRELLKMKLFPMKDSYVAYLKKDRSSIERNPKTIDRLCGRLYDMGLEKIYEKCSEPIETNRQIGPMFNNWIKKKSIGITPVLLNEFLSSNDDAILGGSDTDKMSFAKSQLNYYRNKGLDFVGRFNGKYIIGEAKFLSSDIGLKNSTFKNAIEPKDTSVTNIVILDGEIYKAHNSKFHRLIKDPKNNYNIISVLFFREFLYWI